MTSTPIHRLSELLGGELRAEPSLLVTGFATDNRQVQPGDLFLAIRGAQVDGHRFVPAALASGAVAAVVEEPVDGPHILVSNLVEALATMGANLRRTFDGPVIAITGSAGKTTTKEFVAAALSPLGPILKNPGNRNSEYTSPLLWADLTDAHRAVVVEMGMRGFGQIQHLAEFTAPTIGLITNIGFAHIEMVGSREGIARAKGELLEALPATGTAILWQEDDYLGTLRPMSKARVRTFGTGEAADCRIADYQPLGWQNCRVKGTLDGREWTAELPGIGRHLALNAAAAVLAASTAGVDPQAAAAAIAQAEVPPMRMEIREWNGATFVLDNYNASPPSVIAALEALSETPVSGRRRAVIGEMRELGAESEAAHASVGAAMARLGIQEAIFLGPTTPMAREAAIAGGADASRYRMAADLSSVEAFLRDSRTGDAVLIKGSRALELERAVPE